MKNAQGKAAAAAAAATHSSIRMECWEKCGTENMLNQINYITKWKNVFLHVKHTSGFYFNKQIKFVTNKQKYVQCMSFHKGKSEMFYN